MITDVISCTKEEMVRQSRQMSHWLIVSKELYSLTDEARILFMLKTEMTHAKRDYIIRRIYAHFNSVRRLRELEEIRQFRVRKSNREIPSEES